jgi:hypothetical protein
MSQPRHHLLRGFDAVVRRHEPVYQRTREREPALAPYPTATALFDALSADSPLDSDARQPLLRVVVLEYQRTRHPLWHALALRGCEPMLGSLRARLRRRDEEERDQDLQAAFIEAVGRVRIDRAGGPTFPHMTLRRAIARALFASSAKQEPADEVPLDEHDLDGAPPPHEDPPQFVQCLAREVAERIARRPGGEDVVRVILREETLAEQVERRASGSEEVTYQGLHKHHKRTLDAVRREVSRGSR